MTSRAGVREVTRLVLDGIFPPACLGCSEAGEWLCKRCLEDIPFVGSVPCGAESPLDGLCAVSSYHHPIMGALIRSFKYQRALCLEEEALRSVFLKFREKFVQAPTMIVPLPMDPERERTRGMDHALRLAKLVQSVLWPTTPVVQALTRTRQTHTNASIKSPELRRANVQGVFACTSDLTRERPLLIDDVYTTGATMHEAAKLCRAAGALQVQGLVLGLSKEE